MKWEKLIGEAHRMHDDDDDGNKDIVLRTLNRINGKAYRYFPVRQAYCNTFCRSKIVWI